MFKIHVIDRIINYLEKSKFIQFKLFDISYLNMYQNLYSNRVFTYLNQTAFFVT